MIIIKRNWLLMGFAVLGDFSLKLKESKKLDKYMNFE